MFAAYSSDFRGQLLVSSLQSLHPKRYILPADTQLWSPCSPTFGFASLTNAAPPRLLRIAAATQKWRNRGTLVLASLLPLSRPIGSKQWHWKRYTVDAVEQIVLLPSPFDCRCESLGVPTHCVQVKVEPGRSELMEDVVRICCKHALLEHRCRCRRHATGTAAHAVAVSPSHRQWRAD